VSAREDSGRVWGAPAIRQNLVDVSVGMGRDALEDVGDVVDGVDAVLDAGGDHGEEAREVLSGLFMPLKAAASTVRG
jgi:hypothetical protein